MACLFVYLLTCLINMVRSNPGKPGKYCNLIIKPPGLEYTGILSKVLENLEYEPIFGAVFLPCLYLRFIVNSVRNSACPRQVIIYSDK